VILVTVGGQLPFDRLVHTVDRWAMQEQRVDVFAQIGKSESPPNCIPWQYFLSPSEFRCKARDAQVIVAHAGMGSILTALELGKPIVVMPRRAHLGEHRNDHQTATVEHLGRDAGLVVASNERELVERLARLEELPRPTEGPSSEYARLLDFLGHAIANAG